MSDTNDQNSIAIPRYLAGAGAPDTALNVLEAAGWRVVRPPNGNTLGFAPDRRVIVAFLPEGDEFAPQANGWDRHSPLWVIRAYAHADLPLVEWEATFTNETPVEFIAALLSDLVRRDPLDPHRNEPEPPVKGRR